MWLQQVTAFVHGHEAESWHSLNMTDTMSLLQWDKIPGYTGGDILLDRVHAFCRLSYITKVAHKSVRNKRLYIERFSVTPHIVTTPGLGAQLQSCTIEQCWST